VHINSVHMLIIIRCEFFVSAEQVQLPDIPYYSVSEPNMLPLKLVLEATALTERNTECLPLLRGPLHTILYQLHQLGLVCARFPSSANINSLVAGPLYDTEYALLEVLSSQKQAESAVTDVEILLAATLQLYLWVGPRKMRPQVRLCSLLASRVASALSLFLPATDEWSDSVCAAPSDLPSSAGLRRHELLCHSRSHQVNNLVAWSLALATVAGAAVPIPEYQWLKRYFTMHINVTGLIDDMDGYLSLISSFPKVDGFDWIDLEGLYNQIREELD